MGKCNCVTVRHVRRWASAGELPPGNCFAPPGANQVALDRDPRLQISLENETIFPFVSVSSVYERRRQRYISPMFLGHDDPVVLGAEITERNAVLRKHVWTLRLCSTHLHGTAQETREIFSGGFCSIDEPRHPTAWSPPNWRAILR